MSTKKKDVHPAIKNLALSPKERARALAGCSVYTRRMYLLEVALRKDLRDVLFAIGPKVANPGGLRGFGSGPEDPLAIRRRIALGLDLTLSDCDSAAEFEGFFLSYNYGVGAVLSIARMLLPRHFIKGWKNDADREDVRALLLAIDGCIISLVVRGKLQHAFDLMRLAGCVMTIDRAPRGEARKKPKEYQKGSSKPLSLNFHRLEVLLALDASLQQGKIPTESWLCKNFSKPIDRTHFAKKIMLSMKIRRLLPKEPEGPKPEGHEGSSFPAVFRSGEFKIFGKASEPIVIDSNRQLSASDPEMIDQDIRIIRENLGPLYPLLLIESGMSELEDVDDLREFDRRLSERGLRLS